MTPEDFEAAMDAMFARSMILERARMLRDGDPQDVCDAELADTLEAERARENAKARNRP